MKRSDLTERLLDIKREKGWSWKHICEKIGGYSEVLIVGAILGQMKLTKPQAANAGELFGLSKSEVAMLNEVPMRGEGTPMPPTDPLIYRFYELVMVNGPAWKALIEEEYGDGIMSAIDFDMVMERLPNPKGDRVKITMSGKLRVSNHEALLTSFETRQGPPLRMRRCGNPHPSRRGEDAAPQDEELTCHLHPSIAANASRRSLIGAISRT